MYLAWHMCIINSLCTRIYVSAVEAGENSCIVREVPVSASIFHRFTHLLICEILPYVDGVLWDAARVYRFGCTV